MNTYNLLQSLNINKRYNRTNSSITKKYILLLHKALLKDNK